jgi:hypothetical protein
MARSSVIVIYRLCSKRLRDISCMVSVNGGLVMLTEMCG